MRPEPLPALVAAGVRHALRRVCFWTAVGLPVLYLSAAAASTDTWVVATLVVAHLVALLVGHHHRPRTQKRTAPRPEAPDAD